MGQRRVLHDDPRTSGQRSRNDTSGRLRQKRGDTRASTLEAEYGVELNVRGDARLDTLRERTGATSIEQVIAKLRK